MEITYEVNYKYKHHKRVVWARDNWLGSNFIYIVIKSK